MEQLNLKFDDDYKVFNFSLEGEFTMIKDEHFIEKLDLATVLVIYFIKQKKLYIWNGPKISRELRNQVLRIEGLMKQFRPSYRIMRKFIIEGNDEKVKDIFDLLQTNPIALSS